MNLFTDYAEETDYPRILDMCREFWKHTIYSEGFDPVYTEKLIRRSHDQNFVLVLVDGGADNYVCGMIIGLVQPLIASDAALQVSELAYYVEPEYRGCGGGKLLLEAYEENAKCQGIKYINLAFMESSMPETVRSIYEHSGYKLSEQYYTKIHK